MKKTSLSAIYSALKGIDFDSEILSEIEKELNKGAEKKAQNAEAYESIHDLLIGTLSETPVPFGEIFAALEADLPMGMTKGRVQYALTHLWQDEIVVVKGNPNTYRKA